MDAEEQSEMEYDDYEETEYLRDPVDIDYDPFADERVDAESTEDDSVEDGNGSKDDQGEEVQVEGEPSQNRSHVLEITRPGGEDLFSFEGVFCQRNFKNQLRPKECFVKTVCGQSVGDIIDSLWESGVSLVKRKIIFDDDVPMWADEEKPGRESVDSFMTVQDATVKKMYELRSLTPKLLQKWRGKSIKVLVHAYSTNVESSAQFKDVLKRLIAPSRPDRAGANSTVDEAALANELRDGHQHLEGHFSSWMLWASIIHGSAAHKQETMKKEANPPTMISKYFRWVGVSEAARLDSVHRGMVVANTMNARWTKQVADIKIDLSAALNLLQGAFKKIELLEAETKASTEITAAMETAVQPEENELSQLLASQVTDRRDSDHE
uniref:(northern house mosquito) hypothetical protein n=1 Tax=Culex pipiens TaxID=7175 RepID=A0A8D8J6N2_CULPI